jgi:multimeric flavodoxin WrbA
MKVMALNSSPRGDGQSKTAIMLNSLVEGMREAGAEVEVVSLSKKTIKPCAGCFSCWTKTPGKCIYKDDMTRELFPRWLKSDLVVYASPLYHYTVNSGMKAFIERTLPVFEPFFIPTTVNAPFEIWMDIMTKKADGQQLFMEQKYTVEGDWELLMQLDQLFGQK